MISPSPTFDRGGSLHKGLPRGCVAISRDEEAEDKLDSLNGNRNLEADRCYGVQQTKH
mgnify:CR=1 FL=1